MLEIYQLNQLIAVAENGSLSKAAESLHLSQPALSRSMKKMEDDWGVTLFSRTKNKMLLNDNGELAVSEARKVMEQLQLMERNVVLFDRSHQTISFGSCAPAMLQSIPPRLSSLYPEMMVSFEINEEVALLSGLRSSAYQLIVLTQPPTDADLYFRKCGEETLCFSLPPAHPLAGAKQLRLADLDGENMLLFSKLGFWNRISQLMPNTHFLRQDERFDFQELARMSALPYFSSDLVLASEGAQKNRIYVPIVDKEAHAEYYCACLKKAASRFYSFWNSLD